MYLVPKINLFHTLKLGPQSKESANFFNKVWVPDCRFVPEVSRLIQRQGTCGCKLPDCVVAAAVMILRINYGSGGPRVQIRSRGPKK